MAATLSDETIEIIRNVYVETGRMREAARVAGVSASTAKRYIDRQDDLQQLRTEKRAAVVVDVISRSAEVQAKLLGALADDDKLREATVRDIATAYGIVTDKLLLMRGEPTVRTESMSVDPASRLTPDEMEAAARIRAKLAGSV